MNREMHNKRAIVANRTESAELFLGTNWRRKFQTRGQPCILQKNEIYHTMTSITNRIFKGVSFCQRPRIHWVPPSPHKKIAD